MAVLAVSAVSAKILVCIAERWKLFILEVWRGCFYPPASEVSREVANLTERKNCLSVCLSVINFDPNLVGNVA